MIRMEQNTAALISSIVVFAASAWIGRIYNQNRQKEKNRNENETRREHQRQQYTKSKGLLSASLSSEDFDSSSSNDRNTPSPSLLEERQPEEPSISESGGGGDGVNHKATVLVRYLSENHEWIDYTNDEELYVQEFPKIELHVHLDGAFDPHYLWRYMKDHPELVTQCLPVSVNLPWEPTKPPLHVRSMVQGCTTSQEFHNLCTCRGYHSLFAMLNCFEIFMPLVRCNLDLIEQLAYDFCQRQWEQNTIYTEVRYSPYFLAESFQNNKNKNINNKEDGANDVVEDDDTTVIIDAEMVFAAVTRGLRRGCQKFSITVNQILCALTWRPDWAMGTLEMVQKHRNEYPCATVGVDIAAGEEHFNQTQHPDLYQPHYDMIQRAIAEHVPITLHAGECTDDALDNVRKAIFEYGASRIGHGYRVVQSPELMGQVVAEGIHMEVCPTSSLETGGWIYDKTKEKDWKQHPCTVMKKHGIPFSLSSDDPAVFHTSLAWQYRIALAKMGMSREDILETNLHAVNAAFCSQEEKERLRTILLEYGQYKRLKSDVSEQNAHPHSSIAAHNRRRFGRSVSASFTDRVYISKSQYL